MEWNFSQPTLLHNIKGTYHTELVWDSSTSFFLAMHESFFHKKCSEDKSDSFLWLGHLHFSYKSRLRRLSVSSSKAPQWMTKLTDLISMPLLNPLGSFLKVLQRLFFAFLTLGLRGRHFSCCTTGCSKKDSSWYGFLF